MSERLSTVTREISNEQVDETIETLERQFVNKNLAQVAVLDTMFGEQLMEKRELAGMPVATGGPTWSQTGMTQDATDGDNEFHSF